jgi:hypothetical protein
LGKPNGLTLLKPQAQEIHQTRLGPNSSEVTLNRLLVVYGVERLFDSLELTFTQQFARSCGHESAAGILHNRFE